MLDAIIRRCAFAVVCFLPFARATAEELDVPTLEAVVLATDRDKAIAALVPDSDAQRFLIGLGLQAAGDLPAVDRLLEAWGKQVHDTASNGLLARLSARQDVLWYDRDPALGRKRLIGRLALAFEDTAPGVARRALSDHLEAPQVGWAKVREAYDQHRDPASTFTQEGVRRLLVDERDAARRRQLLGLLEEADSAGLFAAVQADLAARGGARFGELGVHRLLTRLQFAALAAAQPALSGNEAFVSAWLTAERAVFDPGRLRADVATQGAWAARLVELASALPPALRRVRQVALRARVDSERALGTYDRAHILAYLAERPTTQIPGRDHGVAEVPAVATVVAATGIVEGDEEALVDDLLFQVLRTPKDLDAVAPFFTDEWLERRFAELRLLRGEPQDPARALSPGEVEELRNRSELGFAPGNRAFYDGDDAVELALDLKRIDRLLVRVYRLDPVALLRAGHHADAGLDLAGQVPSVEREVAWAQPALVRHRERLALPELATPGQYVVDLVAGGRSLRALIIKGELVAIPAVDRDGQWLTVSDERGRAVADAQVRIKEQDFTAGADGRVRIPFGAGGRVDALLRGGGRASRATLDLAREDYALRGAVLIARSQLIAGAEAVLPIHAQLVLGATALPLAAIEEPRVELTWTSADHIERHDVRRGLRLSDDSDLTVRFAVPEGLRSLRVALLGRVRRHSDAATTELRLDGRLELNSADDGVKLGAGHLLHDQGGWTALLTGRGGEPLVDEEVTVSVRHDAAVQPLDVTLRSGPGGRIPLGALAEAASLSLSGAVVGNAGEQWQLAAAPDLPAAIAVRAGGTASVVVGERTVVAGDPPWRLYHVAGAVREADLSARLAYADGVLSAAGLEPGDYLLVVRDRDGQTRRVPLTVAAGALLGGSVVERERCVPLGGGEALAIGAATLQADAVVVPLTGGGPGARVHVLAAALVGDHIGPATPGADPVSDAPRATSTFATRRLDEEERYILERRRLVPAPGVMAERPGMLLNPAVDDSVVAQEGGFGDRAGGGLRSMIKAAGGSAAREQATLASPAASAAWDVLAHPGALLANLRADAQGQLRIPRAALGDATLLTVVACDGARIAVRQLTLPAQPPALRDRRLAAALDPALGLAYVPTLRALRAGERVALGGAFERYQMIDSVDTAWRWLAAQEGEDLAEWSFLGGWPGFSDARKRELYRLFAGHELHCFLARHDPAFFAQVVAPYLRNKAQPDLVDRWLLGADLGADAAPWRLRSCNAAERAMLAQGLAAPAQQALGRGQARWLADAAARVPVPAARFARAVGAALDLAAQAGAAQAAKPPLPPSTPAPAAMAGREEGAHDAAMPEREAEALGGLSFRAQVDADGEFYVEPGATKLLVESAYRGVPHAARGPDLVPPGRLWAEFAANPPGAPFLSTAIAELGDGRNARLLALALSDLPFTPGVHQVVHEGPASFLVAGSPAILARAALEALPVVESDVLLRVELVSAADDAQLEARASLAGGPLSPRTAYVQRLTMVNTGRSTRTLAVLAQIPQGAVALADTQATHMELLQLAPLATVSMNLSFYFPLGGDWPQHPVVASDGRAVLARGGGGVLHVSAAGVGDWRTSGDVEQVLAGIAGADLAGLDLSPLLGLLRDAAVYRRIAAALAARGVGEWQGSKYGLLHDDPAAIAACLRANAGFMDEIGAVLPSRLLARDAVDEGDTVLSDFAPLVNPRAHRFGENPRILIQALATQYRELLTAVAERVVPSDLDRLALCCYLLLQDRVPEARAQFAQARRDHLATGIQYDYARAWLALAGGDAAAAAAVAATYREHPIERWRWRFAELAAQAAEASGQVVQRDVQAGLAVRQEGQAAAAPGLDLGQADETHVRLTHQRLAACVLRYHPVDVELSFSRAPFAGGEAGSPGSPVAPAAELAVPLPGDAPALVEIPAAWRGHPALIEAVAPGCRAQLLLMAANCALRLASASGELTVVDGANGKPLPAVYVKVYALRGGKPQFHKDGYTDLRGRFDYATLTAAGALDGITRFAILVTSPEAGSVVREVEPPQR